MIATSDGQQFNSEYEFSVSHMNQSQPINPVNYTDHESNYIYSKEPTSSRVPSDFQVTEPNNWKTMKRNSAGESQFYTEDYNDLKTHPEKYQNAEETVTATSKKEYLNRMDKFDAIRRALRGEKTTTDELVDGINGIMDIPQGLRVIKDLLKGRNDISGQAPANTFYLPEDQL